MRKTKEQISYNMSRIKSKNTLIEKKFNHILRKSGVNFKRNYVKVLGKPDFVVLDKRIAVFCDSAFWHGYRNMRTKRHNFRRRKEFWVKKIKRNIKRDREVNRELRKDCWKVVRFWDFQIKKNPERCARKILKLIEK